MDELGQLRIAPASFEHSIHQLSRGDQTFQLLVGYLNSFIKYQAAALQNFERPSLPVWWRNFAFLNPVASGRGIYPPRARRIVPTMVSASEAVG